MRDIHRHLPHVVYRCYSVQDVLLYVGATHNLKNRLRQHRQAHRASLGSTPAWLPLVARITFEEFPDGEAASAAEVATIRAERPVFNISGSGKRSPRQSGVVITPHTSDTYIPRHAKPEAAA